MVFIYAIYKNYSLAAHKHYFHVTLAGMKYTHK